MNGLYMLDRRLESRMMCADLVEVTWTEESGPRRRAIANLEDISLCGACIQMDHAIPLHSTVRIGYGSGELRGKVRYCVFREIGYFAGIEFDAKSRWSKSDFEPRHLLDPMHLGKTPARRDA